MYHKPSKMMNVETPKSTSKCCAFCFNLGIAQPHDHTVRDFSKKDKPITCPKLLQTECSYCHKSGHTKRYCPLIKAKMMSSANNYNSVGASSEKKRGYLVDDDGFISVSSKNYVSNAPSEFVDKSKIRKVGILASSFGALDIEGESDDELVDVGPHDEMPGTDNSITWSSIVSAKKDEIGFVTQQAFRDGLGICEGSSWADESGI